jgi:serine/threonine protein kinase
LADHLPSSPSASPLSLLRGDTKIAIITAGIVLGMRYLHSRQFIHRNLTPDNILLDWNWVVRIGGFSHSVSLDESR